jgi:hypothetical protein
MITEQTRRGGRALYREIKLNTHEIAGALVLLMVLLAFGRSRVIAAVAERYGAASGAQAGTLATAVYMSGVAAVLWLSVDREKAPEGSRLLGVCTALSLAITLFSLGQLVAGLR